MASSLQGPQHLSDLQRKQQQGCACLVLVSKAHKPPDTVSAYLSYAGTPNCPANSSWQPHNLMNQGWLHDSDKVKKTKQKNPPSDPIDN